MVMIFIVVGGGCSLEVLSLEVGLIGIIYDFVSVFLIIVV